MNPAVVIPELTPIDSIDLITWSADAAILVEVHPEQARDTFLAILEDTKAERDLRGATFTHAALARVYERLGNPAAALDHIRNVQAGLAALHDDHEQARMLQLQGEIYQKLGYSAESLISWQQALKRFSSAKDVVNAATCYSAIGTIELDNSQHDAALTALLKACQLSFSLDDQAALAYNYRKLSTVYYEQDTLDQSLAYAHKSLEAAQLAADDARIADAYNMLGVLNKYMEQFEQALHYYTDALHIRRVLNDKRGEADCQHNMGLIFEAREQIEYALHYYAQALAIRREIDDGEGLLRSYAVMGTTHSKLRRYDLSNRYLQRALQIAQDRGARLMEANLCRELSDVHAQLGDYQRALNYQRQFSELRQTVFNEERIARFAEAQAKYSSARDERLVEQYRGRIVKLEKELTHVNREMVAALTREAETAKRLETTQSRESNLVNLKSQIIRVVSHEFRTPLAIISNASYMLERFAEQMPQEKEVENYQRITTSVDYMKELLDDVCWIEAATTDAVVVQAESVTLRQMAARILSQFGVYDNNQDRIRLTLPEKEKRISVDEDLVGQIVFHLVTNALKFSAEHNDGVHPLQASSGDESGSAEQVHLSLLTNGSSLLIEVRDNGIGIPILEQDDIFELFFRGSNAEPYRGLGLGMAIVQKLVTVLDGTIVVKSAGEGTGTMITVEIPFQPAD